MHGTTTRHFNMILWYQRNGKPYPGLQSPRGSVKWIRAMTKINDDLSDVEKKRVGLKYLWWGGRVSTVWIGLNYSLFGHKPLIFETMVFGPFSWKELDMDRYSTEEEAVFGHKRMVAKWLIPFGLISILRKRITDWLKHYG